MAETIIVELGTKHFQEANAAVRAALAEADTVCIVEAYAQRYLGCTLPAGKRLEIHGTPGNDLACYMDGGEVEVFGSAQGAWAMRPAPPCAAASSSCATAAAGAAALT